MARRLPAFVDEVPDYDVHDGRMYISMGDFTLAMPVDIFLAGCVAGQAAVAEWQRKRGPDAGRVLRLKKQ